jgi:hypothetical protein
MTLAHVITPRYINVRIESNDARLVQVISTRKNYDETLTRPRRKTITSTQNNSHNYKYRIKILFQIRGPFVIGFFKIDFQKNLLYVACIHDLDQQDLLHHWLG